MAQAVRVQVPPSAPTEYAVRSLLSSTTSSRLMGKRFFWGPHRSLFSLSSVGSRRLVDPFASRLFTTFHRTLAPSETTVQNQPSRVGAMRFLQPDPHAAQILLLWRLAVSRRSSRRQPLNLLASSYDTGPSRSIQGIPHPRFRYLQPHSAVSRRHCLRQGVAL